MSVLPSLDPPPPGTLCHCGEPLRIEGFCAWCRELEDDEQASRDAHHVALRDDPLRLAEMEAIRSLAQWNRDQTLLDLAGVRKRARAYAEAKEGAMGSGRLNKSIEAGGCHFIVSDAEPGAGVKFTLRDPADTSGRSVMTWMEPDEANRLGLALVEGAYEVARLRREGK